MYALVAPRTPSRTCASVQATTSTIRRARQTMVSFSDVATAQTRDLRSAFDMEALDQVDELGTGGALRARIAQHLEEPGVAVHHGERGDHAGLLYGEVVEREGAGPGLDHLAQRVGGRFVE